MRRRGGTAGTPCHSGRSGNHDPAGPRMPSTVGGRTSVGVKIPSYRMNEVLTKHGPARTRETSCSYTPGRVRSGRSPTGWTHGRRHHRTRLLPRPCDERDRGVQTGGEWVPPREHGNPDLARPAARGPRPPGRVPAPAGGPAAELGVPRDRAGVRAGPNGRPGAWDITGTDEARLALPWSG